MDLIATRAAGGVTDHGADLPAAEVDGVASGEGEPCG